MEESHARLAGHTGDQEIAAEAMKITYSFAGKESVFEREARQVIIGRPKYGLSVDIDLTPDQGVSRPHARIWDESEQYWIEDLNSINGTSVDGKPIKGKGKILLKPGLSIRISETTLQLELPAESVDLGRTRLPDREEIPDREGPSSTSRLDIRAVVDASESAFSASSNDTGTQRLSLLYELPLQLSAEPDLDNILQPITERLLKALPSAMRGALLMRDAATDRFLPKGSVPLGRPAVSETLMNRAIQERKGFVWHRGPELTNSQGEFDIEAGMYAPLLWKEEVLGVICVDNHRGGPAFTEDDLRLLIAVAQHLAMAAVQNRLQEDLSRNIALLSRLLTNFSPKIREKLLARASRGRLRLGGENSEVVIVMSDIRSFSLLTADMESDDIVDLLNEYFSAQVDEVFRFDGTVDKFIGDSILAVFGSPEPDPMMYEKAVRAAFAMQEAVARVSAQRRARGQVTCKIGIGMHCGEVLHGFIGSDDRMEFTIIGSPVNHTSRYAAAAAGDEILISPDVWQRAYRFIESDLTAIQTKHEGEFRAFRVKRIKSTGKL
jgi:adenylate cyclase